MVDIVLVEPEIPNNTGAIARTAVNVKSGARTMTLSFRELDEYVVARGSRGGLLPRGWQKVDALAVE